MARPQWDGGLDCGEKAVVKSLLRIDNETVVLGKLDEVYNIVDVELLFDGGKLPVDRPLVSSSMRREGAKQRTRSHVTPRARDSAFTVTPPSQMSLFYQHHFLNAHEVAGLPAIFLVGAQCVYIDTARKSGTIPLERIISRSEFFIYQRCDFLPQQIVNR